MKIGEFIKLALMLATYLGVPTLMVIGVAHNILRSRRESRELHERINAAIEMITEDGKIEGPKGKYRPRHWSRKWINYSRSLPMPRGRYEMSGRELPTIGRNE